MAYNITKSNGDPLVTLQPGDIDEQSSSLRLLGQGVTNYGELVAENFVALTENFSAPSLPRNPLVGQLWFDSTAIELKVIKSVNPQVDARVLISTNGPRYVSSQSPTVEAVDKEGDLRYFSLSQELRVSDGSNWRRINEVYEGTDDGNTEFPLGTILVAQGNFNRNLNVDVQFNTGDNEEYTAVPAGASGSNVLQGDWRTRGRIQTGSIPYVLVQRVD